MTISWADCEPCGREFKDKKRIQSGPPWKQLSLPRLVFFFFFFEQMAFNFELLHWCKKSLESQAVFLTSLTEAAHQMKGMCEIAFPSIFCLHAQDTNTHMQARCGGRTMLPHRMLKQKKYQREEIQDKCSSHCKAILQQWVVLYAAQLCQALCGCLCVSKSIVR